MRGGVLQTVKDMLFPVFCFGCKREGEWLCSGCIERIDRTGVVLCPVCHEEQPYGMCCDDCRPHSYIDGHLAGVSYTHGSLQAKMIEALKYQYVTELTDIMYYFLEPVLDAHRELLTHINIIVPVPLHSRRYAERGFNQAMVIGTVVAQHLDIAIVDALVRSTYTKQQAKLEKYEREANVRGVFELHATADVRGKDILLIDDVFTTGSTMQAAAKTLRNSGASSVIGLSVARG